MTKSPRRPEQRHGTVANVPISPAQARRRSYQLWGTLLSPAARTLRGTQNRVDVSGLEGVSHQAQRLAGAVHTGRSTALSGPWTSRRLALTSRCDRERAVILVGENDGGC